MRPGMLRGTAITHAERIAVQIMPSKHGKGWRARWTDEHDRRHSKTFRFRRDAEAFERRKKAETEEIVGGLRAERPIPRPFAALCDYWIENRASQKRSRKHDESIIRKHLRPAFASVDVTALGVSDVDRFVRERPTLGRKTLANVLTLLIAMLNLAKDLGWLSAVPRIRKPKLRLFEQDFAFLRTDQEVARVLREARATGEIVHALYATAVFSGMRKGELAALRWEDVDFDRRLITVQRSYEGPTKPGDVRYVPILDALIGTLKRWRLRCPDALLFPSEAGTMRDPDSRIFRETLHAVLARAGLPRRERAGKERPYITFHDFRHTFASHWVMRGGDLFKLQKILGHKSVQMTMRYAHLAPHAFADDWARFGSGATELADVVALPGRSAESSSRK